MKSGSTLVPVIALIALLAAAGCKKAQDEAATTPANDTAAPMAQGDSPNEAGAQPQAKGFDVASVPVSTAPLGAFPYFTLPSGYHNPNAPKPIAEQDRVAFWTGDRIEWVEGKAYQSLIHAQAGKEFSPFELSKNIEQLVTSVGGVKVTSSNIPPEVISTLGDAFTQRYADGLGDIYNNAVTTYVIRRADRTIWIHLGGSSADGGWIIAETAPFQATATLLPADALKQQLESAGKVAIEVNFATDKADILPDSQPQIAQVVELLKADPGLRLSVNGHTDNSGDAAHNQQLSEQRAAAVVAAVAAQGIDSTRLQAHGYGAQQPVADNGSDEGKAKNRRVELVRI